MIGLSAYNQNKIFQLKLDQVVFNCLQNFVFILVASSIYAILLKIETGMHIAQHLIPKLKIILDTGKILLIKVQIWPPEANGGVGAEPPALENFAFFLQK